MLQRKLLSGKGRAYFPRAWKLLPAPRQERGPDCLQVVAVDGVFFMLGWKITPVLRCTGPWISHLCAPGSQELARNVP